MATNYIYVQVLTPIHYIFMIIFERLSQFNFFEVYKIITLTHCEQGHRHALKEIIIQKCNDRVKSVI
jgi:hypothetical protein